MNAPHSETNPHNVRPSAAAELATFLTHNKRWWLTPILVIAAIFGFLLFFGRSGSAPFSYSWF